MKIIFRDKIFGYNKRLTITSDNYEDDEILEEWYKYIINKKKEKK